MLLLLCIFLLNVLRGRGTLAAERGVGRVPIPTRGHTLWYSLYICALWPSPKGPIILYSVVFTPPPPSHHAVFGSYLSYQLLTNTISPVRAYFIHMFGEVSWEPKRRRATASQYLIPRWTSLLITPLSHVSRSHILRVKKLDTFVWRKMSQHFKNF